MKYLLKKKWAKVKVARSVCLSLFFLFFFFFLLSQIYLSLSQESEYPCWIKSALTEKESLCFNLMVPEFQSSFLVFNICISDTELQVLMPS